MISPTQALHASLSPVSGAPRRPVALVAGATGSLGSEVLHRLAGTRRHARVQLLVHEAMRTGLKDVEPLRVPGGSPAAWPPALATGIDEALVLFEPARAAGERERALWTPAPDQLLPLAQWLRAAGVRTLALVLPHDPGRLPDALRRGLANLDEQGVAMLGFERVLIVRAARTAGGGAGAMSLPQRLAAWMLSIFRYMIPEGDRPLRPEKLAEVVAQALAVAPAGVHVLAPELLWQAATARGEGGMARVLRDAWQSTAESPVRADAA
ncbi:MAG: hypothetical protein KA795_07620 [Burkholderiaceae bacterium]|nr:hypothetical protein [Burkholderiaceae bacterium]